METHEGIVKLHNRTAKRWATEGAGRWFCFRDVRGHARFCGIRPDLASATFWVTGR